MRAFFVYTGLSSLLQSILRNNYD